VKALVDCYLACLIYRVYTLCCLSASLSGGKFLCEKYFLLAMIYITCTIIKQQDKLLLNFFLCQVTELSWHHSTCMCSKWFPPKKMRHAVLTSFKFTKHRESKQILKSKLTEIDIHLSKHKDQPQLLKVFLSEQGNHYNILTDNFLCPYLQHQNIHVCTCLGNRQPLSASA